jgi:hypothetical protein
MLGKLGSKKSQIHTVEGRPFVRIGLKCFSRCIGQKLFSGHGNKKARLKILIVIF